MVVITSPIFFHRAVLMEVTSVDLQEMATLSPHATVLEGKAVHF